MDRVRAWLAGKRIAPITVDLALTRACQYNCVFCYAGLGEQRDIRNLSWDVLKPFIEDCAELGVKAISLVSDGESTLNPAFAQTVEYAHELGLSVGIATNGLKFDLEMSERLLKHLEYVRVNFEAGTPEAYALIMGTEPKNFYEVLGNVWEMMRVKYHNILYHDELPVTIGMQMVLLPQYADQIIPLVKLATEIAPDYVMIKHCAEDELGSLGVDFRAYEPLFPILREAESMSTPETQVIVRWNKIKAGQQRTYKRCLGPPFQLEMSGSGLVAPCGLVFNDRYRKYHIGNIAEQRFKDIVRGERYWEVMRYLRSNQFDARTDCGHLCLQDGCNRWLDDLLETGPPWPKEPEGEVPLHVNFL